MKRSILILILLRLILPLPAQKSLLKNTEIKNNIENCLFASYAFNFPEAHLYHREICNQLPSHPASSFLKAIIIYWENFPMLPDDKAVIQFEKAMHQTIHLSQKILDKDPNDIEGIFFDMHARAYLAMFWADNGKSSKVIRDTDNMYRATMKGIKRKDEFNEFYFSSGLYKYYIESYAENHPVYKPILALFKKGNKIKGLEELQYASEHTTFLKTEAIYFLSLLELNYENDLHKAEKYASTLYNLYPENSYYLSQYLIILCHLDQYEVAEVLNENLRHNDDAYARLVYKSTSAFLQEKKYSNKKNAQKLYWEVINSAEYFGTRADIQVAIAYAGLSRIAKTADRQHDAKKFKRKSRSHSSYSYITQ